MPDFPPYLSHSLTCWFDFDFTMSFIASHSPVASTVKTECRPPSADDDYPSIWVRTIDGTRSVGHLRTRYIPGDVPDSKDSFLESAVSIFDAESKTRFLLSMWLVPRGVPKRSSNESQEDWEARMSASSAKFPTEWRLRTDLIVTGMSESSLDGFVTQEDNAFRRLPRALAETKGGISSEDWSLFHEFEPQVVLTTGGNLAYGTSMAQVEDVALEVMHKRLSKLAEFPTEERQREQRGDGFRARRTIASGNYEGTQGNEDQGKDAMWKFPKLLKQLSIPESFGPLAKSTRKEMIKARLSVLKSRGQARNAAAEVVASDQTRKRKRNVFGMSGNVQHGRKVPRNGGGY